MVERKFWGAMVVSSLLVYGTTILQFLDLERSWSWLDDKKVGSNWYYLILDTTSYGGTELNG
jgi:hypothetical protein